MNTMVFYLGALTLCGLSVILIREASPYPLSAGAGSSTEERISMRRLAGRILLIIAALSAGMGVLAQFFFGSP